MVRHSKEAGYSNRPKRSAHSPAHARPGSHSYNQADERGEYPPKPTRRERSEVRTRVAEQPQRASFGASAVASSNRSGGRFGKGPLIFGVIVAIVIIAFAGFFVSKIILSDSSSTEQHLPNEGKTLSVTIPEGATTSEIASILEQSGLVTDARKFSKCVKSMNAEASLKPGTYQIVCGTSMEDIVNMLEAGSMGKTVVIPEGYTISKTAHAVEEASGGKIKADEFLKLAGDSSAYEDDYSFLKDAESGTLEGYLFPKTYEIAESATADSMIRMMLDQYVLETDGLDYSYPKNVGLSEYETLILASIIEREAASENRATVASVFYNRLDEGMCLQSDATVAYVVNRDPKPEDLEVESPYNTYLKKGLPKGPICSPSLASLKAACNPETTDYLYFYFTEDGKYYFSKTYDEHQDAIAKD